MGEVRIIHALMIERYGGTTGERDSGVLLGALAQPSADYFGTVLHPTPAEQAAAYLFYLCQAHAFVDGNKRTAIFSALAFLHLNDLQLSIEEDVLFDLVLKVARGSIEKSEISELFAGWICVK